MLIGTLALLFMVPVLFITFEYLQEKIRPALHEEANQQIQAEREQSLIERSALNPENQKKLEK